MLSLRAACRLLLAAATIAAAMPAFAEDKYPDRPIQIVVPYPPGGANDIFARVIGKRLADTLGQPVVVYNKPGAGGSIGTDFVAKSRPDGYTLVFLSSSFTTNAAIQPKLPFDPVKSFTAVAMVGKSPFVVAVANALPVKTMQELLAMARLRPVKLSYASSGLGSINQFATEQLAHSANVKLNHVPYKGMGPALNDLMGGHVDVLVSTVPSLMQQVHAGKVRGLAITSASPSALAPDLPTVEQSGVPGYSFDAWVGVLAPAGTPPAIVATLNAEINRILTAPDMKEFMHREGAEPTPMSPDAFNALIPKEIARWKQLAHQTNIRAE